MERFLRERHHDVIMIELNSRDKMLLETSNTRNKTFIANRMFKKYNWQSLISMNFIALQDVDEKVYGCFVDNDKVLDRIWYKQVSYDDIDFEDIKNKIKKL